MQSIKHLRASGAKKTFSGHSFSLHFKLMNIFGKALFLMIVWILSFHPANLAAQVSVLNSGLNIYNVTPQTMFEVSIMNSGQPVQVYLKAQLFNSGNEPIMTVRSSSFLLKKGLNVSVNLNIGIASSNFGSDALSTYLQTYHNLPSGKYHYCCSVAAVGTPIEAENLCDDLESDIFSFLSLISPYDKDTIETQNPLLIWNHIQSFGNGNPGEFYRILLVNLNEGQTAESGIEVNNPYFMKNNLLSHQIQYPFDAAELKTGSRYGWQVQKITNGVVTDKTDAWEFTIMPPSTVTDSKYVALKKKLDSGYYLPRNNKIFFNFNEYYAKGKIDCKIYDSKRHLVKPKTKDDSLGSTSIDAKQSGYNNFVIDLNELAISSGFHTLEVRNEKGELYLLKFYIQ
jgi:hypothetical protein